MVWPFLIAGAAGAAGTGWMWWESKHDVTDQQGYMRDMAKKLWSQGHEFGGNTEKGILVDYTDNKAYVITADEGFVQVYTTPGTLDPVYYDRWTAVNPLWGTGDILKDNHEIFGRNNKEGAILINGDISLLDDFRVSQLKNLLTVAKENKDNIEKETTSANQRLIRQLSEEFTNLPDSPEKTRFPGISGFETSVDEFADKTKTVIPNSISKQAAFYAITKIINNNGVNPRLKGLFSDKFIEDLEKVGVEFQAQPNPGLPTKSGVKLDSLDSKNTKADSKGTNTNGATNANDPFAGIIKGSLPAGTEGIFDSFKDTASGMLSGIDFKNNFLSSLLKVGLLVWGGSKAIGGIGDLGGNNKLGGMMNMGLGIAIITMGGKLLDSITHGISELSIPGVGKPTHNTPKL